VLERIWLLLRRVQQQGVREIRGDIVLDRPASSCRSRVRPTSTANRCARTTLRSDALLLNYRSVLLTFTPDPARGTAQVSADPPLDGVGIDSALPLARWACEDWRGGLKAEFADPSRIRFGGTFTAHAARRSGRSRTRSRPATTSAPSPACGARWAGRLGGKVRDGAAPASPPSFELVSPTLPEVIRDINKFSNNVMAQQLFLTLGLADRGIGTPDTGRAGSALAVQPLRNGERRRRDRQWLGLSRETRLSARLLAQVLLAAWASPVMSELMSSLPVAGIDGTMRRAISAPGRAHLKSGSLRDVASVAGFVLGNSGRRYVVVGVVNHANAGAGRPALEALVQWAANDTEAAPSALGR
jgi:D-alanyl-D-alanine carboxypeptidase/D-alanyl-D-alanine-endopeptidase (penicillin-binding protein 4)